MEFFFLISVVMDGFPGPQGPIAHPDLTQFVGQTPDLRRAVYTTNSIENLNRQIRKTIKTRGHFPDEQAATKLIYLAIQRAEGAWRKPYNWTGALRGLKIHFGDRLPI